jgi:hypothetical protein
VLNRAGWQLVPFPNERFAYGSFIMVTHKLCTL